MAAATSKPRAGRRARQPVDPVSSTGTPGPHGHERERVEQRRQRRPEAEADSHQSRAGETLAAIASETIAPGNTSVATVRRRRAVPPARENDLASGAALRRPHSRERERGKPKAVQAAETRALLIDTARQLFAERGYVHVSLQDVLTERGLTKGAIYHHFRDKQALFHAVVLDVQERIAVTAASAGERGADPWLALERVCRAFFRELRHPNAMRIVCQDAGVVLSWAECSAIDERYMLATLRRFIDGAADANLLPPVNRDALLRIVTGAIYHTVEWASHGDAARRIAAGERTLLTMLRAMKRR